MKLKHAMIPAAFALSATMAAAQSFENVDFTSLRKFGADAQMKVPAQARFKIECDLNGDHQGDIDRVSPQREKELLETAVEEAYPTLPSELQDVARQITFRIAHNPQRLSKNFLGWSAEDDPDYRYPDKGFYPNGTIKANFTEKFIRALDLGKRLAQLDPSGAVADGVVGLERVAVAHELRHAWQYHTGPVRDLVSVENSVVDGLADPRILEETKRKIQYERDAFKTHRPIVRAHSAGLIAFADAIEGYAAAHPHLFDANGEYRVLVQAQTGDSFVKKYLRDEVAAAAEGDNFGPAEKVAYDGQYVPAETVLKLKEFNDRNDRSDSAKAEVERLERRWTEFMEGPNGQVLMKVAPYMPDVVKRHRVELEAFRTGTP